MKTRRASPSPPESKTLPAVLGESEDVEQHQKVPGRFRARLTDEEGDNGVNHARTLAEDTGDRKDDSNDGGLITRGCMNGPDGVSGPLKAGGFATSGKDTTHPASRVNPQVVFAEGAMERSKRNPSLQEVVSRDYTDVHEVMGGFTKAGCFAGVNTNKADHACSLDETGQTEDARERLTQAPSVAQGPVDRSNRGHSLQEVVSRQARFLQNHQKRQQANVMSGRTPPPIRWERFLPQYQLRILLVEDDDSTRHVVTALLKNCSYEVTSAASGLLAWGILVAQSCQFDIVLTEVVMSGLSGIGLLSRIMGREALKHIPVVMMSSHDSMGIVFKCLSMGAVDFLVKPVRKNELKNLWQHVWRRCRSSSGSGSDCGSGSRTRKASHQRAIANGDDNSNGNTDNENTSSEINLRGGSDNGSGTQLQGSWTKRAIEVESSQNATFEPSVPPAPGVVQYEKGCSLKSERIGLDTSSDALGNNLDKASLGLVKSEPSLGGTIGRAVAIPCDEPMPMEDDAGSTQDSIKALDLTCKSNGNGEEQLGESADFEVLLENHASNSPSSKEKFVSDSSSPCMVELMFNNPSSILRIDNDREREGRTPGLRHSCSSAFSRYNNSSGCHGMKSSNAENPQSGSEDGTLAYQSSVAASAQMQRIMPTAEGSEFSTLPPPYLSHGPRSKFQDNNDVLLSMKDGDIMSCKGKDEPSPSQHVSELERASLSPGKFFDSAKNQVIPMGPVSNAEQIEGDEGHYSIAYEQGDSYQRSQQIHHHTHYHKHHHHHHVEHHFHYHHKYAPQLRSEMPQIESQTVTNGGSGAPKSGPSSSVPGPNNGQSGSSNNNGNNGQSGSSNDNNGNNGQSGSSNDNNGNNGQSGSSNDNNGNNGQSGSSNDNNGNNGQSGSTNDDNNGNNGQSGSSTNDNEESATRNNNGSNDQSGIILPPLDNGEGTIIIKTNNEGEGGVGKCLVSAPLPQSCHDPNRLATREAALTKFRQKRKERCFEKKVRYQSRKRLAEQRPRVRGQFVRQSVYDFTVGKPE